MHSFLHSLVLVFLTFRFNRVLSKRTAPHAASRTDYSCRALVLVPPSIPAFPRNRQSEDGKQKVAGISQDAQRSYQSSFPASYYNSSFCYLLAVAVSVFCGWKAHNSTFQHILEQSAKRRVCLLPRLG